MIYFIIGLSVTLLGLLLWLMRSIRKQERAEIKADSYFAVNQINQENAKKIADMDKDFALRRARIREWMQRQQDQANKPKKPLP